MKRAIFILIITLPCFTAIGQEEKIELYKRNGKPVLFDVNQDFEIVLKDSCNDSDSTTTSIRYSGSLLSKDQDFLYFKPSFFSSQTSHFEKDHWSAIYMDNTPELPEQQAVNLDRINYLSQESPLGEMFGEMAALGLMHVFITGPATSLRFHNWNPSFNRQFYLKQMAITLPVTVVSLTCYYTFSERTFKVKKE